MQTVNIGIYFDGESLSTREHVFVICDAHQAFRPHGEWFVGRLGAQL